MRHGSFTTPVTVAPPFSTANVTATLAGTSPSPLAPIVVNAGSGGSGYSIRPP